MCNAWNHPSNCKCGWGGEGHLGRREAGLPQAKYFFAQEPKSFTIPNVICRHCGSKVFYYENSHGSKVFFDHLGPPWPKHSCKQTPGESIPIPNWEVLYRPYSDDAPDRNGNVKIEGYLGKVRLSLFAKIGLFNAAPNFKSGCVFIKRRNLRLYHIQYINDETGQIKELTATTFARRANKRRR
jgi:hypothetical protein